MSDITFKNVATLMTCIMKDGNKLYLQPVSKEDCFLNKQDNNMWWKTHVRKILVPEKAFSYIKKYLIKKKKLWYVFHCWFIDRYKYYIYPSWNNLTLKTS